MKISLENIHMNTRIDNEAAVGYFLTTEIIELQYYNTQSNN